MMSPARDGAPLALRFLRGFDLILSRTALYLAATLLAAMASVTMWQVLARFVFQIPQAWSEALVRTLMVWIVFLALATAYQRGVMVAVDLAHRLVPASVRIALECVVLCANLAVLGTGFYYGVLMADRVSSQMVAGLGISIAWGYAAIPCGCAIALVSVVRLFIDRMRTQSHEERPV